MVLRVKCLPQHFSLEVKTTPSSCVEHQPRRTHPCISWSYGYIMVYTCQMSPTTFLSGSEDNTIKLWNINHIGAIRTFVDIHVMCSVCVKCHQQHFSPEVMTKPLSCGTSTTTKPSAHFVGIHFL